MQVNRGFLLNPRDEGKGGAPPMWDAGEATRCALLGFGSNGRRKGKVQNHDHIIFKRDHGLISYFLRVYIAK
jgi:hypothetical protein